MSSAKKHENEKNPLSQVWDEFLFAREFEYESPLSPDELAAALKSIEIQEHRRWLLSSAKLNHRLEIQRSSDKALRFRILLYEAIGTPKDANFILTEGRIDVDADSGLSIIQGKTRFGSAYFAGWINVFALSLLFFFFSFSSILWAFALLGILYWVAMLGERNELADRLDKIIMQAKAEGNLELVDSAENEDADLAQSQAIESE